MNYDLPDTQSFQSRVNFQKIFLAVITILFFLSILSNIYLYISFQKQQSAKSKSLSTCPSLPFPVTDSAISMAGIAYKLYGNIWQLNQKGLDYEIIFEGKDGKVYTDQPLTFKQTALKYSVKSATSSANNTLLKTNSSIILNYYFDLLKKIGYVTSVEITQ